MALIGRDREAAVVHAFLASPGSGPSALVIEGDAGVGKTALFDAALSSASGLRVLTVRCVQAESALAHTALADLFGPWTQATLPELAPPQRRALEVALLRTDPGDDVVEPHAVGRAALEFLRMLAAEARVLVAIDDVQWLDPASARTLGFAVRRLDGEPVSVLATRRTTDRSLPLGLDDAAPAFRQSRLVLGPLPAADLEAVLDRRFSSPLPRPLLSRILTAAAGNPLYAIELAAAHGSAGGLPEDRLTMPARLQQILADRLGRLPTVTAEPLAAVASVSTPTVASVVAVLGEAARAGLNIALDSGVLHVVEGRLRFTHPLYSVAASAALPPSAIRELHARLAAHATDPVERAHHLVAAADGPDPTVAASVEEGADLARSRGAPEIAAGLAEAAVRLTPPSQTGDVVRRRVAAGYHWATAGEVGRGRAAMAAALDDMPPGPARADLRWRLGMLTHLDGDLDQAVQLLEAARAEAADLDRPDLEATVAHKLAGLYGWQGRLDEAVRCAHLAVRYAQAAGDPRAELESLIFYGRGR